MHRHMVTLGLSTLVALTGCGRAATSQGIEESHETPQDEPFAITISVSFEIDADYPGEIWDLAGQTSSIGLPHCSLVWRDQEGAFRVHSEADDPEVFGIALVRYQDGGAFSGGGDGTLARAYETPEQSGDVLQIHAAFDRELELYSITPYEEMLIQGAQGSPAEQSGDSISARYSVDVDGQSYTVTETHTIEVEAPVTVDVQPIFGCD